MQNKVVGSETGHYPSAWQMEEEEEGGDEDRRERERRARGREGRSCLVPELSISSENLGTAPSWSSPVPSPPCPAECPCVEWSGAQRLGCPCRRRGCAAPWNSWCQSPCAPLPSESSEEPEDPLATTSAPRGGQRAPLALGNGDKKLGGRLDRSRCRRLVLGSFRKGAGTRQGRPDAARPGLRGLLPSPPSADQSRKFA